MNALSDDERDIIMRIKEEVVGKIRVRLTNQQVLVYLLRNYDDLCDKALSEAEENRTLVEKALGDASQAKSRADAKRIELTVEYEGTKKKADEIKVRWVKAKEKAGKAEASAKKWLDALDEKRDHYKQLERKNKVLGKDVQQVDQKNKTLQQDVQYLEKKNNFFADSSAFPAFSLAFTHRTFISSAFFFVPSYSTVSSMRLASARLLAWLASSKALPKTTLLFSSSAIM